jgi:putative transposase
MRPTARRFAWNWGLAKCKERYEAEGKWYSAVELHKLWNAGKKADPALAWWSENSKCAYQEAFRDLDRALRDFARSRKGQRKGKRLGFPRFKKRGKARDSFRLTGALRCDGNTVTLPRLGTLGTHESTGKLSAKIADGTARVLSAAISRTAQRWYVSFTVEAERDVPALHARPGSAAGVDLGVRALLSGVDSAGRAEDRDVNAARNLLHLAASGAERVNACGGTVRPRPARQDPLKQEPGAAHAGKTGTAPAQAGTAA